MLPQTDEPAAIAPPAPPAAEAPVVATGLASFRIYWWLIAFPGGLLVITLLALNFLGDGLRDAWDVRG